MQLILPASVFLALLFLISTTIPYINAYESSSNTWIDSFNLGDCEPSPTGSNSYFFLEPGYQLTLEGQEDGDRLGLVITVLNETKLVNGVETRLVEERESENGELVEVSLNYLAVCKQTNDIFYFGEDVEIYADGELESHEGAWLAGENGAKPGLIMPANPTVGLKYYMEIAPGIAEDRAEIISLNEVLNVPAGSFDNVLKVEETTPLESRELDYKYYAPGVGLLQDEELKLTRYSIPEPQESTVDQQRSQPQSVVLGEKTIEVLVNSSSTITNFALDEENKQVTFTAEAQGASQGITEIYIGTILEGPYTVSIDGQVVDDTEVIRIGGSNSSIIKVTHTGDSSIITIAGTNVVPEFPLSVGWLFAAVIGVLAFLGRHNAFGLFSSSKS